MRIRSIFLILLGFAIICWLPVSAEPPGSTIKHVNYAKRTVTVELYRRDQGTRQVTIYKIDPGCTFTVDGVTATLKQIHRGQHVMGMTMGEPGVIDTLDVQTKG
jgi:hypothetical protein